MKLIKKKQIIVNEDNLARIKQEPIEILSIEEVNEGKIMENNVQVGTFKRYRIVYNFYNPISYETLVGKLIERKYDINSQIAIIRQKATKSAEFNTFFKYCEECKEEARQFVNLREQKIGGKK